MSTADLRWNILAFVGAVLLPVGIAAIRDRQVDWVGAAPVFAASMLCGFVLPLGPYLEGIDGFTLRFPILLSDPTSVRRALNLAAWGALAFGAGFLAVPRLADANPARAVSVWRADRFAVAATSMSLAGLLLFGIGVALLGGLSALFAALGDRLRQFEGKNYFFQAIVVHLSVALVWFVRLLRDGRAPLKAPGFAVFLSVAFTLVGLLGNKSTLFVAVVALAVIYARLRRALTLPIALLGAAALIVGLTIYALFAREYLVTGALQSIDQFDAASIWRVVQVELGGNFIQLQTLSILIDQMPGTLDWQMGKTPLALVTMPVPRVLWPGKPLPATGPFTDAFFPGLYDSGGTTIPPGLLGEWYMNFGQVGVVLGMLAFGVLYGWLAARWRRLRDDASLLAYALMVGLLPHYVRGEMVSATVAFLLIYLPAYALLRVSEIAPSVDAIPRAPECR
jgi:oligosaccharide repeat unit polymerase